MIFIYLFLDALKELQDDPPYGPVVVFVLTCLISSLISPIRLCHLNDIVHRSISMEQSSQDE